MTLSWPSSPAALMVWGQLLLLWVVAMYYVKPTSAVWGKSNHTPHERWLVSALPKIALLLAGPLVLFGGHWGRALLLSALAATLGFMLTWARERGKGEWLSHGAEIEVGLTIAFVFFSALISGPAVTDPRLSIIYLPLSEGRIAALILTTAIALFLINGGTQVVRAVLTRSGAEQSNEVEYNKGRLIGNIERALLLVLVATGNWTALGFTIAAKGLVRSQKFTEDPKFAEYFLIGTLTSAALAIVAGALVRITLVALW